MPDKFDPYREALVMETNTIWPDDYGDLDAGEKERMAKAFHADPENVSHLEYIRTHTGFCRQIVVTAEDVDRLEA